MNRIFTRILHADWRILMGVLITFVWISAGAYLLLGRVFEGAFAPLAFLWLVIGLFIQQKELADNTEVLRQSSIQSEKQTQAIAATELNARQETFFKIAENVKRQLGSISGMLFVSSMGTTEGSVVDTDTIRGMWTTLATGDNEVFAREFLIMETDEHGGYEALFYGTEIRARHAKNYCETFERLIKLAENCDTDGLIVDSMTQTGHGLLYNRMKGIAEDKSKLVDASHYRDIIEHAEH
jgi:hypothetical protein